MRKHFLLLFLMALLPLAGWAADGKITEPTGATELTYDGTAKSLLTALGGVEGSDYSLRYYVTNSATEIPTTDQFFAATATTDASLKGTNAGTYYVYFISYNTVTGEYSEIGPKKSVVIAKKALVKDTDFTAPTGVGGTIYYDGTAKTLIAAGSVTAEQSAKAGTLTYALEDGTFGSTLPTATNVKRADDGTVTTYAVKYKLSGSANYAEYIGTIPVAIQPKAIEAGWITYVPGVATRTYGGDWAAPTVTVTPYSAAEIPVTTQIVWHKLADLTDEGTTTPTDAGTYYAEVVGTGNFGDEVGYHATDRPTWRFTVDQKQVRLLVNPQSKVYNGAEQTPDAEASNFTAYGLTDADEALGITGLQVTKVTSTDVIKNVGKYFLKAKDIDDNVKIGTGASAVLLSKNYTPVYLTQGYIEITKKALTVAVNADKEITYGAALPAKKPLRYNETTAAAYNAALPGAIVAKNDISADEADAYNHLIGSAVKSAGQNISAAEAAEANTHLTGAVAAGATSDYAAFVDIEGHVVAELNDIQAALSLGLKKQNKSDAEYYNHVAEYDGCWAISFDADAKGNPTNATLKNYSFTPVNRKFSVAGAGFTIMAVYANKEYDGESASNANLSYLALDESNNPVTIPSNVTVVYEYLSDAATDTWSTTLPSVVGNYKYRVKANSAYASGDYDASKIKYEAANLRITPKTINISVDALTLHTGDNKAKLNQYASYTVAKETPLVGEEELNVYYEFETATINTAGNWDAVNEKLKDTNDGIANAINVRLVVAADYEVGGIYEGQTEDLKDNGNYILNVTKGTLKISGAASLELDDQDVHLAEKLADANNKVVNVDVTFTQDRIFRANKWYAIVLPFETTVRAFSTAMGYATVDVLDATKSTASFVQYVGKIEANTPFIFKVDRDINLKNQNQVINPTTQEETWTGGPVVFNTVDKKIDFTTNINADNNAEIPFGGGVLIGTYGKTAAWGTNQYYMSTTIGQDWVNPAEKYTEQNPRMITPFRAILKFNAPANGARIFIQEPDGSTTAIGAIAADGELVPAEGWYTLNGVKLQGIPTQKGIYINNGKKVVVK